MDAALCRAHGLRPRLPESVVLASVMTVGGGWNMWWMLPLVTRSASSRLVHAAAGVLPLGVRAAL